MEDVQNSFDATQPRLCGRLSNVDGYIMPIIFPSVILCGWVVLWSWNIKTLSIRPPLWILLSMLMSNFGELLYYASNQNTDFQCARKEKNTVQRSIKKWFLSAIILWGEVISKEDKNIENEVEFQIAEWLSNSGNPQQQRNHQAFTWQARKAYMQGIDK